VFDGTAGGVSLLRSLVVSSTVRDTTDISEPMTAGFDAIKGCQQALSTPVYETKCRF
jgi:hypothetical protein